MANDCILGLDTIKTFGLCINFHSGTCSLPGEKPWKINFPGQTSKVMASTIDSISAIDNINDTRFFLSITIKGKTIKALVDSGSTRTYIGSMFESILAESLIPSSASVLLADNSIEPVVGEINIQLSLPNTRKGMPVRLVRSLGYDCILGIDFLMAFGMILDFEKEVW